MRYSLALAFLLATPAIAQGEDEAHRLDRLRTEQLNHNAAKIVDAREDRNDAAQRAYRSARTDYERRMAAWRRRVAACNAGDWSACS
jgi:transcription elongation GreA/GreB family factor